LPARPLTLLQDLLDGALGARQVGHANQLRPTEITGGGLRPRRPAEKPGLTPAGGPEPAARPEGPARERHGGGVPAVAARGRPALITGTACPTAARPSASARSIPSGRSRNMKCRSACSPKGSRASWTPAG